jgi:pimeloyl-ACP methyl ester carboxylesterase
VRIWIAAASAAVFALASAGLSALQPPGTTGVLQTNPPTPYFHTYTTSASRGRILVVHGLDASKDTMQMLSAALADGGFEVYSIDMPGHGDSTAGFDASLARETIRQTAAEIRPDVVLGHSLGAGLLLDLAEDQHFPTMVLLSPPPLPVSEIQADRVLVITGAWDIGRIRNFAPLVRDIGDPRIEWWNLRWAAHSSAIFNPVHIGKIVEWLSGDPERIRTTERLLAVIGMLLSAITLGVSSLAGSPIKQQPVLLPALLVRYIAACIVAILTLKAFIPLAWLRLFATDYLISFLFLAGVMLWIQSPSWPRTNLANTAKAFVAAAFVIGLLGLLAGSSVLHMSLSAGRWWRFPFVAAAGLPLFLFDETTIRKIHPRWLSIATAVVTKALLWAFVIAGVLLLNRGDAFLVLIAHLMVFFWIALWFGAHVVHRHTQDPFAAALFAALVQGWAFAAWFVLS